MLLRGLRVICVSKSTNAIRLFLTAAAILAAHSAFAQTWTQLAPTGTPPVARGGVTGVYDSVNNLMIVFGGRNAGGNNLNDVWVLTNASGAGPNPSRWVNLIPNGAAGSPPARSGHSAVYDSTNNRMIIFGGCSANCAPALNDVWVLANANGIGGTPAWTQLSPGAGPAARTNAAAVYDPAANELIVFGGQDGSANPCSTFSDTWILQSANGLTGPSAWLESLAYAAVPAGQNGVASSYTSGALNLFGGTGTVNGTCTVTNTLWELIGPSFQIVGQSIPQGAIPPARSFASLVSDTVSGEMLVFGGVDASGSYLNDVWNFFGAWSQFTPKNSPPPARSGHAAVLDSTGQRMIVFGGSGASGVLNDTWVLYAPSISGPTCTATAGVPNIVSSEGIAEQMGDVVLNCTGGTPTSPGEPIPEYWITYTLNTDVTSRLLSGTTGLSEALLFIDDPFPVNPVPSSLLPYPSEPPQILCTPLGADCTATGTGGTPSPYQTQPNVFAGKQDGAATLYWKVPIDPPGPNFTRVIRITNVRANASLLGVPSGLLPNMVQATVGIQGYDPLPLAGPQQLVAVAVPPLLASVALSASISQCEPHNAALLGGAGSAAFDFSIQATEAFSQDFKYRNYGTFLSGPVFPPLLAEQNVPGYRYFTETGFYSPSLFTTAPGLGLGFFGTRILVLLGPVSAGTKVFVPTAIALTGEYGEGTPVGQLQLIQGNQYGNSAAGYEPVASTAMVGTTPVAEANSSGALAYATYEVIYADPNVQETATIPVAVAFTNVPTTGEVQSATTLAPLSSTETTSLTAPIPRFANFSTAQEAYSITSCPAP